MIKIVITIIIIIIIIITIIIIRRRRKEKKNIRSITKYVYMLICCRPFWLSATKPARFTKTNKACI